jgi:hypothetical protein
MTSKAPPAARQMRVVGRIAEPSGSSAIVRAGDVVGGFRCVTVDFPDGAGMGGCSPWPYSGPKLGLGFMSSGGDVWITGHVTEDITTVVVRFHDGSSARVEPVAGLIVYPLPIQVLQSGKAFLELTGLDDHGRVVTRRSITVSR